MMFTRKLLFVLSGLLITAVNVTLAQPGGGGDPGAGEPVPLQGLFFLLLAGAYLGIKKLARKRN
jgi:hypothetical protein